MAPISNRNSTKYPHSSCRYQRKSFIGDHPRHYTIERQEERWKSVSKRSKKWITISTETNHIPWGPVQIWRHFPYLNKIPYWSTKVSLTCPTSCQIFQDWFLSTANVALTPAPSTTRLASTSDDRRSITYYDCTYTTVHTTPKMTNRLKAHHLHTLHAHASCTTSQYTNILRVKDSRIIGTTA